MPNFNKNLLLKPSELNISAVFKYLVDYAVTHRIQLTKFATVGILVFFIYFLCFHFFYDWVHLDYRIAVSIAYVIAVISHFSLHRIFTFRALGQEISHNLWKYFVMLAINYTITIAVMWFIVTIMKISPYFGLVATTAATALVSFVVMKYFVFDSKGLK